MHENHLFIIWENARAHEDRILADISDAFNVTHKFEIKWSKKFFSDNLSRFYGTNLPPGSGKEEHIGTGRFLLVLVEDEEPDYNHHETSHGVEFINSRTFLSKTKYRDITGGGHKIHGTNSMKEFKHDIYLLLGMNIADIHKKYGKTNEERIFLDKDVIGSNGWKNLREVFNTLNETIDYVVMRNYDPLPNKYYSGQHGDIDFLVDNYENAKYILNAKPVFAESYRVHNRIIVGNKEVLLDLRYIGDDYYDKSWQINILKSKIKYNDIYVMGARNHFFSLLYHALIHKLAIADDYIVKLGSLNEELKITNKKIDKTWFDSGAAASELGVFLATEDYEITRPEQSVYYNEKNVYETSESLYLERIKTDLHLKSIKQLKKPTRLMGSRHYRATRDNEDLFIKFDEQDFKHEYDVAKKTYNKDKDHFVRPLEYGKSYNMNYYITVWEDGDSLEEYVKKHEHDTDVRTKKSLIQDLYVIFELLRDADVVHRDIIPRNFLVVSGRLMLIDFHYAVSYNNYQEIDYVKNDIAAVRQLGESYAAGVYKWDDAYSFMKIAEYILGSSNAKDYPLIKKIASKIGERVIVPDGRVFSEALVKLYDKIGQQQTELIESKALLQESQATVVRIQSDLDDMKNSMMSANYMLHELKKSMSYRIGRKITLPYRLLKTCILKK